MSFKMYHSSVLIDKKGVSHITSEGKVNTVIQAINLASFLGVKEELNQTETWEDIFNKIDKFLNSSEIELSNLLSSLSFVSKWFSSSPNQQLDNIHLVLFQPHSCGRM
uniref:Uncharacterized protein n=1 Tax=Lepeophtheirus salmonis TaxID=72036 RepID=A0A0K2V9B4_LEPSM